MTVTETMSPSEAARVLGLSKTHVLRLADTGALPAMRTPLGRLLDSAAVHKLAERREEAKAAA